MLTRATTLLAVAGFGPCQGQPRRLKPAPLGRGCAAEDGPAISATKMFRVKQLFHVEHFGNGSNWRRSFEREVKAPRLHGQPVVDRSNAEIWSNAVEPKPASAWASSVITAISLRFVFRSLLATTEGRGNTKISLVLRAGH